MLAQLRHGIAPRRAGDPVPLLMHAPAHPVAVAARPRLDGREVGVVPDQHDPVIAGHDPVSAILQSVGRDLEPVRVGAPADENLHRNIATRLRCDGQLRSGDLLDVGQQFLRGQSRRSRRLFGDDDLGPRPAVFDDERLGGRCLSHRGTKGTENGQRDDVHRRRTFLIVQCVSLSRP